MFSAGTLGFFRLGFPSFISEWGLGGVLSIRSKVASRRAVISAAE